MYYKCTSILSNILYNYFKHSRHFLFIKVCQTSSQKLLVQHQVFISVETKKRKLFFKHNLFSPLVDQRINIKDDHLEDIFILWPERVFKFSSFKTQIASNYSYLWFKVKMLNEKPKQSGFSLRELQKYANALKSRKTFTK